MSEIGIRVAVSGSSGRMGRVVIDLLLSSVNHQLVRLSGAITNSGSRWVGCDVGQLIGSNKSFGITIGDSIEDISTDFDVLIDFSNTCATMKYLDFCNVNKKNMVIGTTGFQKKEFFFIKEISKNIGIVFSPNFSIMITLMLKLLEQSVSILGSRLDIEMIDMHHRGKRDVPSGTAIKMQQVLESSCIVHNKKIDKCSLEKDDEKCKIKIHSIRAGDTVGEHTVLFVNQGERLEIVHRAFDREIFANGAIRSAIWIGKTKIGLFDMNDVLEVGSALLVLEDGSKFYGTSIGIEGVTSGEVIFNTSMTGYQEIITDPSYAQQIIVFTYPHIGNVGVNELDDESSCVQACGLAICCLSVSTSNFRHMLSFSDYLIKQNVVGISDIDTRRLTCLLRDKGVQNGCIVSGKYLNVSLALRYVRSYSTRFNQDVVREVSTSKRYIWSEGSVNIYSENSNFLRDLPYHVVVYDFGIKRNIMRMLVDRGCRLTVVPASTNSKEVCDMDPDGILLSNGPGDPSFCNYAIFSIQCFLGTDIPIFGICLGHQLLALASGAKILKMKFGHHGSNHPVKDLVTNKVIITSQNHGFMVDHKTLPSILKITHVSLFDGTLEGMHYVNKSVFSHQWHPEGSPGPHDSQLSFDYFINLIKMYRGL